MDLGWCVAYVGQSVTTIPLYCHFVTKDSGEDHGFPAYIRHLSYYDDIIVQDCTLATISNCFRINFPHHCAGRLWHYCPCGWSPGCSLQNALPKRLCHCWSTKSMKGYLACEERVFKIPNLPRREGISVNVHSGPRITSLPYSRTSIAQAVPTSLIKVSIPCWRKAGNR